MTEEYWVAVLEQEDCLISNSDRKFRYHCYSLESMSEELAFQERTVYIQEDVVFRSLEQNFLESVQNEHLSAALARLTDRQRRVIELHFWQGYQYNEIAGYPRMCPVLGGTLASESVQANPYIFSE